MSAVPVPPGRRYRRRVTAAPATPTSSRPGVAWPGLAALAGGVTRCCSPSRTATATTATSCTSCAPAGTCVGLRRPAAAHPAAGARDGRAVRRLAASGCGCRRRWRPGCVVLLTGLIAREFGGGRGAQLLAAGVASPCRRRCSRSGTCVAPPLRPARLDGVVTGCWCGRCATAAAVWLAVGRGRRDRAARTRCCWRSCWPALAGRAARWPGRGRVLRSRWPWLGALRRAGAVGAEPGVAGRARVAAAGAVRGDRRGSSGTQRAAGTVPALQLVLVSPLLVPVWVAGWWRLARDPAAAAVAGVRRRVRAARAWCSC